MSGKQLGLLFALCFVGFLIVSVPARVIAVFLPSPQVADANTIVWAPLNGTIWSGNSAWLQAGQIRVEPVRWRLAPINALFGTPLFISVDNPVRGKAYIGGNDEAVNLRGLQADASLNEVVTAIAGMTLGVNAALKLEIEKLDAGLNGCENIEEGVLVARDWSSESWSLAAIGVLKATISCKSSSFLITIVEPNAIQLKGDIQVSPNGQYRMNLRVKPPRGDIYDLLDSFFGPARAGEFVISHSG